MVYPPEILTVARELRGGVSCSLVDEPSFQGGSHRVFKIVFEDLVQWAARVCHHPQDWEYDLRAVKIFRHVKQANPEIRAPKVFFKEEHPVLYSEWVSGEPLTIWNLQIPHDKGCILLNDLAEFLLQLWTTPPPSTVALMQDCSYSAWLMESLDRGLRRTLSGKARWGNAIDYLIMRSQIPHFADGLDGHVGVGLGHGDLNAQNIMKDENFRLAGVIDWDWVFAAPLPAVIHHPWFIADIPGWRNAGVSEGETFGDDRRYLEQAIRQKEVSRKLPLTVSTLLFDSGRRFFFQSSFHCKEIHEEFVKMHCARTVQNMKAASSQLDDVLYLYPELLGNKEVQEARKLLEENV